MNTITLTDTFREWLHGVKDPVAKAAILTRITRARLGNFGDCHDVGDGMWEMRIDVGKGYRAYYVRDGLTVYLILSGGGKKGQDADIKSAKAIWKQIKSERSK